MCLESWYEDDAEAVSTQRGIRRRRVCELRIGVRAGLIQITAMICQGKERLGIPHPKVESDNEGALGKGLYRSAIDEAFKYNSNLKVAYGVRDT